MARTDTGSPTVYGTLDLNGYSPTIGDLEGGGAVTNTSGASTLSVGGGNATGTFSGVIQDGSGTVASDEGWHWYIDLDRHEHLQRRDDDQRRTLQSPRRKQHGRWVRARWWTTLRWCSPTADTVARNLRQRDLRHAVCMPQQGDVHTLILTGDNSSYAGTITLDGYGGTLTGGKLEVRQARLALATVTSG